MKCFDFGFGCSREVFEQREKLDERARGLREELEHANDAAADVAQELEDAETKVTHFQSLLDSHDAAVAQLGERQAALTERLANDRHERAAVESRRHLLEEMKEAGEGLDEAVRTVLEERESYPGIRGLLGDAISTDREHAPLVEAALGENLNLVLTESREVIEQHATSMRELQGHITLVPADGSVADTYIPAPFGISAALGRRITPRPIMDLVRTDHAARGIVHRLLNRTAIIDRLEDALEYAKSPFANGWRIVTADAQCSGGLVSIWRR